MGRSFALSSYLATTRRADDLALDLPIVGGPLVVAVCEDGQQSMAIQSLRARLDDDGETIKIVVLTPDQATQAHVLKPALIIWLAPNLNAAAFAECMAHDIAIIIAGVQAATVFQTKGHRWPGVLRALLQNCTAIFALNDADRRQFIQSGASEHSTFAYGGLEQSAPQPPLDEEIHGKFMAAVGTRPVWLAAAVPLTELDAIIAAHRFAARRAHRLMLVISFRDPAEKDAIAEHLHAAGLRTVSDGSSPRDSTQVILTEDISVWSRIASLTYLGGSLTDGHVISPLYPVSVGSALVAGRFTGDQAEQINRFSDADAVFQVESPEALGQAVETILASDIAARYALAAWEVTSQGADVTDSLIEMIYQAFEQSEA